MEIKWDTLAVFPPPLGSDVQYGLSGTLNGICNDKLVIAGGSNFEDKMPWEGGTKFYRDDIYVSLRKSDNQFEWFQPEVKLPLPIAYSSCVSTHIGILSIGGESQDKILDNVLLLTENNKDICFKNLPDLPIGLTSSGATLIGKTVYLAGGLDTMGATSSFLALDLLNLDAGWKLLSDMPEPLSHAVVVRQSDGKEECVFVIGGRNKTNGVISTFSSNIWKYIPSKSEWVKAGILQLDKEEPFGLSAGTGVSFGKNSIILYGGDKGDIFNQTEKYIEAIKNAQSEQEIEKLKNQKNNNLINHPGFCKDIYLFNTISGELQKTGVLPDLSQVTTNAFWWGRDIIIPGGEIRPGVRSLIIRRGRIDSVVE